MRGKEGGKPGRGRGSDTGRGEPAKRIESPGKSQGRQPLATDSASSISPQKKRKISPIVWDLDDSRPGAAAAASLLRSRSQAFKDGTTQRQFVDMVQETAQQVSALPVALQTAAVFNVAKREGLNKLLSAGNAVVSQVTKSRSSK